MPGPLSAYIMAFAAMLLAGGSALTLFYVVAHFDPPDVNAPPAHIDGKAAA